MQTALIVIHVIISLALIVVVLMQHGKQQGLSGAIAGGAETFFGKNKGRTIDAMLKKVTAVIAVLFVASSVVLAVYTINESNKPVEVPDAATDVVDAETDAPANAETDAPANAETDAPANAETDAPANAETDAPANAETDAPADADAENAE